MVPSDADPKNVAALFQNDCAAGNIDTIGALHEHFAAHGFSPTHGYIPKVVGPPDPRLAVHICLPSASHPFLTLFTSGMSDEPQHVPEDFEDSRFSELMVMLSEGWLGPLTAVGASPPGAPLASAMALQMHGSRELEWVLQWLVSIARHPLLSGSWVGAGHFFPSETPGEALLPGTGFTGILLLDPIALPWKLHGRDGRTISLNTLVPLYPEEIELMDRSGPEELRRRFMDRSVGHVVDPKRPNVALEPSHGPNRKKSSPN